MSSKKNITLLIKDNLDKLPPSLGQLLSFIPYGKRPGIGKLYNIRTKEIQRYEALRIEEQKTFIFDKVSKVVASAYHNIPFYKEYYDAQNFRPSELQCFEDISNIPIINKKLLQQYPLEYRTNNEITDKYIANTGGSSGTPLSFYITSQSIPHEWAHMHTIWNKLNFKPHLLKLVFIGRSNHEENIKYDSVRHHYTVNIYKEFEEVSKSIKTILKKRKIYYLHGYPSAIHQFAIYCEQEDSILLQALKKNLQGIFYASEYPSPISRKKIKDVFEIDSVSWYGHTERAVLAYEKDEEYEYYPFGTYGFAEGVEIDNHVHLLGTTYYNLASPLIRYDTEDLIQPIINKDGVLKKFKVAEGRIGEFIKDKKGKRIALTALIFGRHHKLFDYCSHIQIYEEKAGKATIIYTPLNKNKEIEKLDELFDTSGVAIDFDFRRTEQPLKTSSGKTNLLVKYLP